MQTIMPAVFDANFNWNYSLSEGVLQIHSPLTKGWKCIVTVPFLPLLTRNLLLKRLLAWAATVTTFSLKLASTCSGRAAVDRKSDGPTITEHLLHCVRR